MMILNGDHMAHLMESAGIDPKDQKCWPWPSFDAMDWAEAMHKRFPSIPADEFLPWTAAMLMRGYDEGYSIAKEQK